MRRKLTASAVFFSALFTLSVPVAAQPPAPGASEVVEVTATRLSRELYEMPAAVSVISAQDELRSQQALQLDEALRLVPGLYFQNRYNFAQNLRISARGFGARAPFGVRGLHLQMDGIPFTLPDGQSQVDAIDLDAVERLQVIRGPAAVQYGNGAGGVIDITSASGETLAGFAANLDVGSHDFYKVSARAGGANEHGSAHVSLMRLSYRGYRDQSEVDKRLLHAKFRWDADAARSLTLVASLLDLPTGQDPGGLTLAQVAAGRRHATPMAVQLNAGQQVEQQTAGLIWRDETVPHGHWSATAFASRRDFFQQLPFPGNSQIEYDRWFYGAGIELAQDLTAVGIPLRYSAGVDVHRQEDDRQRYLVSAQNVVTGQSADEMQKATSSGAFMQSDWLMTERLTLSGGARYDWLRMAIDDRLGASDVGSGQRRFEEFNGVLGFSFRWHETHQLYGNISTAYESPTFTEFANPWGAGFNPDLEAQQAMSRELGMRGQWRNLNYDVALFSTRVKDEIVPFEIAGRTFYENAGRTDRDGVEIGLMWQPDSRWQLRSAVTLAAYEFRDFGTVGGERVDGNRMPGLPRQQWVSQVRWQHGRWQLELDGLYTGAYYAENSNDTRIDAVWLVDARATVQLTKELALHAGVRNLTGRDYFGNVRINANSDRPLASRGYFEPGPDRTFWLGLRMQFGQ